MSEAAAMHAGHAESYESPLTPESWGKLGMWVFLVGDAMSFGTLLAAYGGIRYGSADWPKPYEVLGIWLTAAMTLLLIVSSVWMVKGLAAIQRNDYAAFRKFIGLTILGGVVFLGCQAYEWNKLIFHEGLGFASNPLWGVAVRHDLFHHYWLPWYARHGWRDLPALYLAQRHERGIFRY